MEKDDLTWLNISFVTAAIIFGYVALLALETLGIQTGWIEKYDGWYPWFMRGAAIAVGVFTVLYLRSKKQYTEYYLSAISEVRKMVFPTWPETKKMTTIVCVVVGIFAFILFVFDVAWGYTFQSLISLFS